MTASDRPAPRSAGTLLSRRSRLPWPADREFRILSIDGGGIRGIFPAAVLAGLEERFLGGNSVARYFDLIAGTSTGGILALGLGAGLTAAELLKLYVERGCEIFPPLGTGLIGRLRRRWRARRRYVRYIYDQSGLVVTCLPKVPLRKPLFVKGLHGVNWRNSLITNKTLLSST